MTTHRSPLRVRFSELDPYAHVNHAVYLVYFEAGRVEAMLDVGIDLATLRQEGWQLVVVDVAVRYRAPAFANEQLVVETELVDLAGANVPVSGYFAAGVRSTGATNSLVSAPS